MILGWDIGGANIKAVAAAVDGAGAISYRVASTPLDIAYDAGRLAPALRKVADRLGPADTHAITMTAELSRAFRTKREGVAYILDAFATAVPEATVTWVYTIDGRFVTPADARANPMLVAAANWMATATVVARSWPSCLLIDVGSTSTDIIPVRDGRVVATGRTDPERLSTGELVYAGALRTPVEALVRRVPLWGGHARVAAEHFATTADVHLWLDRIGAAEYLGTSGSAGWNSAGRESDGSAMRATARAQAAERLARAVCGDRELLDDVAIEVIARAVADAQIAAIVEAIAEVRARHPVTPAVVTGIGDFIAADAARAARLDVVYLSDRLGAAARVAPAAAVAMLLADSEGRTACRSSSK